MLTVPRSWWVSRPVTPNSVDFRICCQRRVGHGSREGIRVAGGAPALVVGNEQRIVRRVQHNRARRIADRDHAQDGVPRSVVQVDHGDRVGVVKRDVGDIVHGIDGDRVRPGAVGWFVSGHADRQPKVDRPHHFVDDRCRSRRWCRYRHWRPTGGCCPRRPCRSGAGRSRCCR